MPKNYGAVEATIMQQAELLSLKETVHVAYLLLMSVVDVNTPKVLRRQVEVLAQDVQKLEGEVRE
jgi:hypothetical protein